MLLAAFAGAAHPAESSTGAPLPGLELDEGSEVAAQSCSVTLSGEEVSVVLALHASSAQPALLIEGPLFGRPGASEGYADRHFPELEIRLDGAPLIPEDSFAAFMGKTDITRAVRNAGMDPWAIAHDPPVTPVRADARMLKTLERMRAVERSGEDYLANWTARRIVRIPLGASANQRLELRYRARPALSQLQPVELLTRERAAAYCVSPKTSAMLHAKSRPRLVHVAEYSIATGIDRVAAPTVLLTKSAGSAAAPSREVTFACDPQNKSIAVAGDLISRPVSVDPAGNLRILVVTEP